MAHIWFMHDAHLGCALFFLDMLAEYTLLSMTVMVTPCLWYVVGMKLVCPMSKFPQAPSARAPLANADSFRFPCFFVFRFPLFFLCIFLSFPRISEVPRREAPLLFWGFPLLLFPKKNKGWRVREEKAKMRKKTLANRNRSDFCDLRLRCPSRTNRNPEGPAIEKNQSRLIA